MAMPHTVGGRQLDAGQSLQRGQAVRNEATVNTRSVVAHGSEQVGLISAWNPWAAKGELPLLSVNAICNVFEGAAATVLCHTRPQTA